MKSKSLNEMSAEELLKQEKSIKIATGMLAGMLLLLLVMGIYLTFKKGSYAAFIVIPMALLPIVILNVTSLKKIKSELNTRGKLR